MDRKDSVPAVSQPGFAGETVLVGLTTGTAAIRNAILTLELYDFVLLRYGDEFGSEFNA